MRYYKLLDNGYITSVGTGGRGGEEITESEYNEIREVISSKPTATETMDYRLREDLTWEPYEVEPPEPAEDELDDAEALEIILGGAV